MMGSVTPRIPLSLKASILENMDLVEVVVFEEEEEEGDGRGGRRGEEFWNGRVGGCRDDD